MCLQPVTAVGVAQAVREAEERQSAALEAGPRTEQQPQPKPAPSVPAAAKRKAAMPIVRVRPVAKAGSQARPSQAEADRGGGGTAAEKRKRLDTGEGADVEGGSQGDEGLQGLLGAYDSGSDDDS